MSKTMENFVSFELAKKLKDKGFELKEPYAMYNELGVFHALYSSAGIENYYDYDYFDEYDYVCPTISQVLKWLRKDKKMHIITPATFDEGYWWELRDFNREISEYGDVEYTSYEQATLAGIEYVLDNLIK